MLKAVVASSAMLCRLVIAVLDLVIAASAVALEVGAKAANLSASPSTSLSATIAALASSLAVTTSLFAASAFETIPLMVVAAAVIVVLNPGSWSIFACSAGVIPPVGSSGISKLPVLDTSSPCRLVPMLASIFF